MKKSGLLVLLLFVVGLAIPVLAQESIDLFDMDVSGATNSGNFENPSANADYIIGANDEILINVNVWGEIKKTGHFMVPSTTDLLTLISHAGGPLKNANIGTIKIVRINLEDGDESIIYVDLEDFLQSGNYDLIPILKPGDTVIVPGNFMSYFSDFVNVVAKVALIVNTYLVISDINK